MRKDLTHTVAGKQDPYTFSREHGDNAFRIESELYVAYAGHLLYDHPTDPHNTDVIRERRIEAAATVSVSRSMMAERNLTEGDPTPFPALIALRPPEDRSLARRSAS